MSRLTPVHYKDFEKFLFYVGCSFSRQQGDHRIYKRPGLKRPIVIPAEKSLPTFIILNNLRLLNISKEQYLEIMSTL